MTDNALIARDDDMALEAYGDLARVREMTKRLMVMLPSVKELGPAGAGALAQASLAMGLNPFIGQIWAIPQRGGTYGIMVGISGLRAKAHEQARADGGMYSVFYRLPRSEEIEGLKINQGDIVRACDLTVSGKRAQQHKALTGIVPVYTGIGVYRNGESTKMNPLQVARKRAEAEAIKQAFDVPLSFVYGGAPPSGDIELDDEPERYEEHGSGLVNGSADRAIAEIYGDYVEDEQTGDPFLNGDYHGAQMDADAREDLREDEQEPITNLDYSPDWLDTEQPRQWGRLYFEARQHLGYVNDQQVEGALKKNVPDEDERAKLTYRSAWYILAEHQRSKQAEPA